ncbi:MAG: ABC transporter ATP-binding protein [Bacteroidota bacterium]
MSKKVIRVNHISKRYIIGQGKNSSLYHTIGNLFKKGTPSKEEFWALNDVSFDVEEGEVLGVIGKNGAGKSTLLKILSRITEPTYGKIQITGRVASLLEVGTGFHPELTGKENIFLNGSILGMKRQEINAKFDEIVDFSGISKFIDTPVKHYSSGMYVRLAFSVAAHLEPEILIIDEVLAVGDKEFQDKCLGKMNDVSKLGRTIVFVSHNMNLISLLCKQCLLLKGGKILTLGNTQKVVESYLFDESHTYFDRKKSQNISKCSLLNSSKSEVTSLKFGEPFYFSVTLNNDFDSHRVYVSFLLNNENGIRILSSRSVDGDYYISKDEKGVVKNSFTAFYERLFLRPNVKYLLSIRLLEQKGHEIEYIHNVLEFQVEDIPHNPNIRFSGGYGIVANQPIWNVE